ncbi:phage head closure protein [Moraxella sp. ZJ142]|uniref:phage head closure protein n=1 Tax=Moraxella marmotae TaxID=3344520 RepID=UPI0035D3FDF2
MKAATLRHRIKIYKPTAGRSATGAVKAVKWEHILTIWGQFSPLSVKDVISGQAAGTSVTARLKIRHRTDITHQMRVEHTGKMYDIVGEPLADDGSGLEYLTLMLKAVSA